MLGTGSNGTISRHLKVWREQQDNRQEAEQGLPESLLTAVKGLYEAIKAQADDKIIAVEQEAQYKIATLESQLAALAKSYEGMLQEKIALEKLLASAEGNQQQLQEKLDKQSHNLSQQAVENQHLQARFNDKQQEVERLSQQVHQAQAHFEYYSEAVHQEREAERQRVEASCNASDIQIKQEKELNARLQQTVAEQNKELMLVQAVSQEKQRELGKLQEQFQQRALMLQQQKSDYDSLQANYQALQESYKTVADELKMTAVNYHALQVEWADGKGRLEVTQAILRKAEDEVVALKDSNLFLSHENGLLQTQLRK